MVDMGSGKMIHRKVVCGICGEKIDKSEAVRDIGSDTGWICDDCARKLHPEYEDWGEW